MKARIIKGGWYWHGVLREVGEIVDETPAWIANRVVDGLVEPMPDEPPAKETPEAAVLQPPETATIPTPRPSGRKR